MRSTTPRSLPCGTRVLPHLADRRPATGDRDRLRGHRQPADDPDLLTGIAGSPYVIRDYFDVSPDYAIEPKNRLLEFKALLGRLHAQKLRALIDFLPNHVARSYHSDVKPEIDFGAKDDRSVFFAPGNNFFYLQVGEGPPCNCRPGRMASLSARPANSRR